MFALMFSVDEVFCWYHSYVDDYGLGIQVVTITTIKCLISWYIMLFKSVFFNLKYIKMIFLFYFLNQHIKIKKNI